MFACDFDMMFTSIYVGWEGTKNDARVFLDVSTKPEVQFPWPSEGKYYLVDFGYPCTFGFLLPHQGEDIIYKNIKVNVINLSGIKNFLIINIHPFEILLKGDLVF